MNEAFQHLASVADAAASMPINSRNDAGNATEFINRHGKNLRFIPAWKTWLVWKDNRWHEDHDGAVTRLAIAHSRELLAESATIEDDSARAAAAKHALAMGNLSKINPMLELARYDARIILGHDKVNAQPMLLGTSEGVIDLRTGTHRPAGRDEYVTKKIGVQYDSTATCPRWRKFISEIFNGDESLCRWMQKAAGYTLTGSISEQCFLFLYGHGSNGKSTFVDSLERVIGEYARRAAESLIKLSQNGRDPSHEIADLHGTRLSLSNELEAGMKLNENIVKSITGDAMLKGRRLYQDAFEFPSTAKLWISGNHKPAILGTDNGIWRRVRLVPFVVKFEDANKDPALLSLFQKEEAPGILNWILEGVALWQAEGLGTCDAIAEAVAEYREDSDTLGAFMEEATETADKWVTVSHAAVFQAYSYWCDEQGIKHKLQSRRLAAVLQERGWEKKREKTGLIWMGRTIR